MAFTATNKAPGVYIDEIQLPGPIAGVSTSVAAFVGPAKAGPINTPVFLTNWTQFSQLFGVSDRQGGYDPYLTNPDVFVTHAVRGFFDNGGTTCYFVRASKAKAASLILLDRTGQTTPTVVQGQPALVVTAKQEGAGGDKITVAVKAAHIANAKALQFQAAINSATGSLVTLAASDAANFNPGDTVIVADNTNTERVTIAGPATAVTPVTSPPTATLPLANPLANTYASATIRIADLVPGQTKIRVDNAAGFELGSFVTITQVIPTVVGPPAVPGSTTTESAIVLVVDKINKFITLSQPLKNGYKMSPGSAGPPPVAADPNVTIVSEEFTLTIGGAAPLQNLSMDFRHSRYFSKVASSPDVANTLSVFINLPDTPNPTPPPKNLPVDLTATTLDTGAAGADENLAGIGTTEYSNGIDALATCDDVNLLCVPDGADNPLVQKKMIDHCEALQDRFAILDPSSTAVLFDADSTRTIKGQLQGAGTAANPGLGSDGGYAALYFPRIIIAHPVFPNQMLTIPPSGHLAGMFARTDDTRGVHKAPANEILRGAVAVQTILSDGDQGPLNEIGINIIRFQKGRGVVCWGARTISTSTQWRYVSTRRLLLFIEKSIQKGTQFAVFEPNELSLWGKIDRQVTDFLTRVWKTGALFGAAPDAAFRVKVDEELNPPDVRALGQLVIEVVVLPSFPAEFVVFRIIQDPTGAALQEK